MIAAMFIVNQYWIGDKMREASRHYVQDYHITRRFFAMLHFARELKREASRHNVHLNRIERQVRLLSFLLGAIEESLS